jgi:hypothetical protein
VHERVLEQIGDELRLSLLRINLKPLVRIRCGCANGGTLQQRFSQAHGHRAAGARALQSFLSLRAPTLAVRSCPGCATPFGRKYSESRSRNCEQTAATCTKLKTPASACCTSATSTAPRIFLSNVAILVFLSISNLRNFQRSFAARRDKQRCSGNVSAVCARVCACRCLQCSCPNVTVPLQLPSHALWPAAWSAALFRHLGQVPFPRRRTIIHLLHRQPYSLTLPSRFVQRQRRHAGQPELRFHNKVRAAHRLYVCCLLFAFSAIFRRFGLVQFMVCVRVRPT